jgi:predicted MPP superfamily phosphohydrolase
MPFTFMTGLRGLITVGAAGVLVGYLILRYLINPKSMPKRSSSLYWTVPFAVNLVISGCLADGLFVEPAMVRTEHVNVQSIYLVPGSPPLRIVHLSDIHVERLTDREREAIRKVNDLKPDLLFLTGDYLNLSYLDDAQSRQGFRDMIGQLRARYGIYAVWGNTDLTGSREQLFAGLNVTVLQDAMATIRVGKQDIHVLGLDKRYDSRVDRRQFLRLIQDLPWEGFNILLYHTPDLMPEAAASGKIDLYLAGHTHGGQVRLPFYGAIFTSSAYGKRYEAGFYREGRTSLYVNRGLGLEGGQMPRVRFLCPPEITLLTPVNDFHGANE